MDLKKIKKEGGKNDMKLSKKTINIKMNCHKQNGITLIALVVTIVVLLILAGVSINALFGNSGIIEKAKEAQNKMDKAAENDRKEINRLSDWIEEKTGSSNNSETSLKSYEKANKDTNGMLTENAVYTDKEKAKVTIPKGFKVSDVVATANSDGEQTVSKGLVIQDKDGNEFVWIPVNYTATGVDTNNNDLDDGFEAKFKRNNSNDENYSEPFSYTDIDGDKYTGYPEEETDYMNMMKSVQKNNGFYIGRYETGTKKQRTSSTTDTIVVQRDAYPYTSVGWGDSMSKIETTGAVYLSKNMYTIGTVGATSTLCYGVQWDAIMNFVEDSTHNIINSTSWGNYRDNAWTINRPTASYYTSGKWTTIGSKSKTKTNSEEYLLTTGASDTFKAKNIFDLAGNVEEWTMEAENSSFMRVLRGGLYYATNCSVSNYNSVSPATGVSEFGFRIALYL